MSSLCLSLYPLHDTIAAVATPPGQGGIGIVRVSGRDALGVLQTLLRYGDGKPPLFIPRVMRYGWVRSSSGEKLDEVLAVYMPGPASFTGENVAEIHCHGGGGILAAVLAETCRAGARVAERGEFTYRAFANGKLDLTKAEAVAEMIAAPACQGVRLAQAKLSGMLGVVVISLREKVEVLRSRVALAVDFPEEEAECLGVRHFMDTLEELRKDIATLIAAYNRARLWREGALVLLAGRVNMGKSSLLNALLGRNRAIVSAIPGTTRDIIEEYMNLDGLQVRLADTAGLRNSADPVEMEGVSRALETAREATLVALITDATAPLSDEERTFITTYRDKMFVVRNKLDMLPEETQKSSLDEKTFEGCPSASVSAKTGLGLDAFAAALRQAILEQQECGEPEAGDIVPNARQRDLLTHALKEADSLAEDIRAGMACDLFSVRLDSIAAVLDEITGFSATDAILGRIFKDFCIGK